MGPEHGVRVEFKSLSIGHGLPASKRLFHSRKRKDRTRKAREGIVVIEGGESASSPWADDDPHIEGLMEVPAEKMRAHTKCHNALDHEKKTSSPHPDKLASSASFPLSPLSTALSLSLHSPHYRLSPTYPP